MSSLNRLIAFVIVQLFLSCSLQSGPLVNLDSVLRTFRELHPTVYELYAASLPESALHQKLSNVFTGRRLTREYIEHFTTLYQMELEETAIDVRQVDYNQIEVLDFDVDWVRLDVDWSVGGVVTHQGHKHTRVNRYHAVYLMTNTDRGWRISDVKMRNAERIRRATDEDILNGVNIGGGYLDPLDLLNAGMLDTLSVQKGEQASDSDASQKMTISKDLDVNQ